MVKIPRVDEPTIPTQIANQPNIPMGFGTAPGRELQRMGQTITQVAAKLTAESNKQQEYETQLRQVQLQNKLYTDYTNSTSNYSTEQDPNKWHQGSREKLRGEIDTFVNSAPEHMRPRLRVWGETLYGNFDRRYGGFAQGQARAKFVAGITGAINSEYGKFGVYDPKNGPFDPEKFGASFGQVQAGVEKIIAAAPGLNELQKQQLRASAGNAAAAAIMRSVPAGERINIVKQYLGKYGMKIGKDGQIESKPLGDGAAPGSPRAAQEEGGTPGNVPAPTGQPQGGTNGPWDGKTRISYNLGGATRNREVSPQLKGVLEYAAQRAGVQLEIFSGGQRGIGESGPGGRVGSTRHDHGNAADIRLRVNGNLVDMRTREGQAVFANFVRAAREAGATGIGAHPEYMGPHSIHVGFGPTSYWGKGKSSAGAPAWLRFAFTGANAGSVKTGGAPPQSGGGAVLLPSGYKFDPAAISGSARHWRSKNAPYQIVQLAGRYGITPEQLLQKPELIAAYIGIAEGGSGARAKAIAEGVLDRIDIYGGGLKGVMRTISQYDTLTMGDRTRIGKPGESNRVIARFNTASGQEILNHLAAVRAGQTQRIVPPGYVGNFSPSAARVQPINPSKWGNVTAPDGRTIYAPTWAFAAVRAGKYRDFNGEILVPQDLSAGSKVRWTSTQGGVTAPPASTAGGLPTLQPATVEDHAAKVLMGKLPQLVAAHERGIKTAVEKLYASAGTGIPISPQYLESLGRQVEAHSSPETRARFDEALRLSTTINALLKNHPSANQAWLGSIRAQLQSKGGTPEQIKLLQRLEKVVTEQAGKTKTDQLTWANNAGVIKLQPLNVEDDTAMRNRLANVQKAAETFGASAPGQEPRTHYFTAEERNRLSKTLMTPPTQEGQPPPIVALTKRLVSAWGASHARRALAELGQSGAGAQALLGGHLVAMGETPVAKDAGEGLLLRSQKGYKPPFPVKNEEVTDAMRKALGMTFQAMPQTTDALRQLANAAYENRARRLGWTTFDAGKYQEIVLDLLGRRTVEGNSYGGVTSQTFGGNGQILVPPDVRNDSFVRRTFGGSLMDLVTTKMLEKYGGDVPRDRLGNPISEQKWKTSYLISVGDGRYYVTAKEPSSSYTPGDAPTDHLYRNKNGTPYVFDFSTVRDVLRSRRPDWFINLPGEGDPYAGWEN